MAQTLDSGFVRPLPDAAIDDYAPIGNCRTLALVSRYGSIDWMCLPHFSGPSYFAALLDRERGGCFALTPLDIERAEQQYVDLTNVLRTVFHCRGGVLELTDFFAMKPHPPATAEDAPAAAHQVVRIARCIEGEVELQTLYRPRPDYAQERPQLAASGDGRCRCTWAGAQTELRSDLALQPHGDATLIGRERLRQGERREAVLASGESDASRGDARPERVDDQLAATLAWWRDWSARCHYDGRHRDAVMRSSLVLKLLTYEPSGAMVAAGTTSLPEGPDGSRNWDYRYCWLRDTSLVLQAFLDLGHAEESEAFLGWLLHATRLTRPRLQVMYDVHGETELDERILPHLRGYHGIGPVRIGNAAVQQRQLDIYGEVLLTACEFVRRRGQLDADERKLIAGFARMVCQLWREPDHGIWEVRTAPRHNTHSKLMCWAALDRVLWLHDEIGLPLDAPHVRAERDALRADIEAHGWCAELDSYVGYYGARAVDASLLLMPRLGYLDANDPRMQGTLRELLRQLSVQKGLLYRYPPGIGYDGVAGCENLFAICSFWCVDCLARQGRIDEAQALFDRLLALRNHAGLYAEEFDVKTLDPLGNFPQAFSHVGMITAALSLERHSGRPVHAPPPGKTSALQRHG